MRTFYIFFTSQSSLSHSDIFFSSSSSLSSKKANQVPSHFLYSTYITMSSSQAFRNLRDEEDDFDKLPLRKSLKNPRGKKSNSSRHVNSKIFLFKIPLTKYKYTSVRYYVKFIVNKNLEFFSIFLESILRVFFSGFNIFYSFPVRITIINYF